MTLSLLSKCLPSSHWLISELGRHLQDSLDGLEHQVPDLDNHASIHVRSHEMCVPGWENGQMQSPMGEIPRSGSPMCLVTQVTGLEDQVPGLLHPVVK